VFSSAKPGSFTARLVDCALKITGLPTQRCRQGRRGSLDVDVRKLRTRVTKGAGSKAAALAMAYELLTSGTRTSRTASSPGYELT